MPAKSSASILASALANFRGELTVADASTRSGLPLREAEEGLRALAADYAGHLAATSKGELIYSFPRGLVKPAETRLFHRAGRALWKAASAMMRFVVRAWVSVVLVGYAGVFLIVLIALALRGGDDRDSPWDGVGMLLRVIAEALFWTFHPFSPMALRGEPRWMHVSPSRRHHLPFYERVNRFVFGPSQVKPDPRHQQRDILAEIRRQKGRIAPGDVMRVTGLAREEAELLLLRLVVDYEGDIAVSDAGAITYRFADLRTTTDRAATVAAPAPIWSQPAVLPPLTGNAAGSNLLFALINGFNLVASGFVIANDLTLERLTDLLTRMANPDPAFAMLALPPADGVPLVLGVIPFAFSVALFALPLVRLIRRPAAAQRIARQNGWRAVLRQVLRDAPPSPGYKREELARAWQAASGRPATEAELDGAVRDLGGTIELGDDGTLLYKFDVVAGEMAELLAQRSRAHDDEAAAGPVVFSSADAGTGIRPSAPTAPGTDTAARADETRPPKLLLEEQRDSLEFLERLMAESKQRPRD